MIADTLQDLVDALNAADVPASLDPNDLNLPGVFVTLDRLATGTLTGSYGIVRARLLLLVPERDARRSLEALEALYVATTAVVTPSSDTEALPANYAGAEVPALSFTTDLHPL